jgi:glutathionyl-hydroquinone reductase
VNNESLEIIRMLSSEFNEFATNPEYEIYPKEKREEIDNLRSFIYPNINNGVYRCGFATKKEPCKILKF